MPHESGAHPALDEKAVERNHYPVAIIGAGATGLAMGYRLKEEFGLNDFKIYDRQSGIGGTFPSLAYQGLLADRLFTLQGHGGSTGIQES